MLELADERPDLVLRGIASARGTYLMPGEREHKRRTRADAGEYATQAKRNRLADLVPRSPHRP